MSTEYTLQREVKVVCSGFHKAVRGEVLAVEFTGACGG